MDNIPLSGTAREAVEIIAAAGGRIMAADLQLALGMYLRPTLAGLCFELADHGLLVRHGANDHDLDPMGWISLSATGHQLAVRAARL